MEILMSEKTEINTNDKDMEDSWWNDQFKRDNLIEGILNSLAKDVYVNVELLKKLISDVDWDSKRQNS